MSRCKTIRSTPEMRIGSFVERRRDANLLSTADGFALSTLDETADLTHKGANPILKRVYERAVALFDIKGAAGFKAYIIKPGEPSPLEGLPPAPITVATRLFFVAPVPPRDGPEWKSLASQGDAEAAIEAAIADDERFKFISDSVNFSVNALGHSMTTPHPIDSHSIVCVAGEMAAGVRISVDTIRDISIPPLRAGGRVLKLSRNPRARAIIVMDVFLNSDGVKKRVESLTSKLSKRGISASSLVDPVIKALSSPETKT
jgi:hypothetical protein